MTNVDFWAMISRCYSRGKWDVEFKSLSFSEVRIKSGSWGRNREWSLTIKRHVSGAVRKNGKGII